MERPLSLSAEDVRDEKVYNRYNRSIFVFLPFKYTKLMLSRDLK